MLSFDSILNESGKSSIEALHYCKMMLKSFKKSKLSPIYGIIRDKKRKEKEKKKEKVLRGIFFLIPDDAVDRQKLGFFKRF